MAVTGVNARCSYCGARGQDGRLVVTDLRGIRYDYCDAACATAHRQAVELLGELCPGCDEDALGDTGACWEHLEPPQEHRPAEVWRRAG